MDNNKPSSTTTEDGTVLSLTEVQQYDHADISNDATQIMPNAALDKTVAIGNSQNQTVLSGATEAISQAPEKLFAPKRITIGSTINNRFTLTKLLGRGGMGEVYLASDARRLEAQDKDPYVAIKLLSDNFKNNIDKDTSFKALQREYRKTSTLSHPNIVTVYDFDKQDDVIYVTMEALSGQPMDEEIRNNQRSTEEAINLITQSAKGLAYAHEKGLVHSDLKPGNIFLTKDNNVKLLDFGIARAFNNNDLDDEPTPSKTKKNQPITPVPDKNVPADQTKFDAGTLGALTPAYASYEMLTTYDGSETHQPHPSDDVYALGLIAYELLTGKHAFNKIDAKTANEKGLKPEKIASINKQQWKTIQQALTFQRADRIQNAQQFYDAFTTKSKTPLYITAVIIMAAFIGISSLYFTKTVELAPEIPFSELPQATQEKINTDVANAKEALQFNDVNGAIHYLDDAFRLHQYNKTVMQQLEITIDSLINSADFQNLSSDKQQQTVNNLLQYESLKANEKLQKYAKPH